VASYVLDTHAIVYHLTHPAKLGRRARAVMRRADAGQDRVLVPAAVGAEIALLRELGRIGIGLPELRGVMVDIPTIQFLPLDLAQLDDFAALVGFRDPFDRLIVAAARTAGFALISRDTAISDSGQVRTIWD
jgi:PIN domain nuclease of toxin-antitoxin system